MELRTYQKLKAVDRATLERTDEGEYVMTLAQYDAFDASEAPPLSVPLRRAALEHALGEHEKAITDHTAELAGIRVLLADMSAADKAAEEAVAAATQ